MSYMGTFWYVLSLEIFLNNFSMIYSLFEAKGRHS